MDDKRLIRPTPSTILKFGHVIFIFILVFIFKAQPSHEQLSLCPTICNCDDVIICNGSFGTTGLPHTFDPMAKKFIIHNGQLSQFGNLDTFSALESVDMSNNKLTSIDFGLITKNVKLSSFNTSHNSIFELKDGEVAEKLATLRQLVSGHKDEETKSLKFDRISVVDLVLSHNKLKTIRDFTFIRWHKLQKLDLSHNLLEHLEPLSLFGLKKLEELNLQNNQFLQIPTQALHSTINSLANQEHIMTTIRSSSLKFLYLSENPLNHIGSNSFASLERVQELYLDSCSIDSIDDQAFKGLHTIQLLSLNHNNLQEVPSKSFYYLSLLRILQLNANNISKLSPQDFNHLVHLEELQLNNGSFVELKRGDFSDLVALRKLEVSHNVKLKRVEPGTLEDAPGLNYLDLSSNSLSSLSISDELQRGLQYLDLRKNRLVCACELKWLTKWLKKKQQEFDQTNQRVNPADPNAPSTLLDPMNSPFNAKYHNLTCSGPPALIGKQIIDLPDNKLECLEPNSNLNVQLGFASLFLIAFLLTFMCLINFCRDKRTTHLFVMLKKNLVHMPYSQNLQNTDDFKKETQLYGSEYEPIDFQHQAQIYTVHNDQGLNYGQHSSQFN